MSPEFNSRCGRVIYKLIFLFLIMKYCKKCKNIMKPVGDGNTFECVSCKYIEKVPDLISDEKMPKKHIIKEGIVKDKNINATYDFRCEKCGYGKAEVIERQPYISDEDSLTFLRCGKCGFTRQLARKIR